MDICGDKFSDIAEAIGQSTEGMNIDEANKTAS